MAERAVLKLTGKLARRFEDYPVLVLQALLFYDDEAAEELHALTRQQQDWIEEQERTLGKQVVPKTRTRGLKYDQPVSTGDPVADEWEKMIAEGRLPDWMKADG